MRTRFSHIRDHLRSNRIARDLLARNKGDEAVVSSVRALLPGSLAQHCVDAGIVAGKLTLCLDSSAWLTRARFLSEEILAALEPHAIDEIRFLVRPPSGVAEPEGRSAARPVRRLSDEVVRVLLAAAEDQSGSELGEALRRFARRHAETPPRSGR